MMFWKSQKTPRPRPPLVPPRPALPGVGRGWRRVWLPWLLLACLLPGAATAWGQQPAGAAVPSGNGEDPAKDILIEGIGFAKLVLQLEPAAALQDVPNFARLRRLLEKNLCWSGVFHLKKGRRKRCRPRAAAGRADMRLEMNLGQGALELRLVDLGPENLVLHRSRLPLDTAVPEARVMDVVNRLTERITGQRGLLGSAIAFVLRQPRYAKVIVATDTHGLIIKPISHNRGINLLPKWAPDGLGMVYTVLGNRGTKIFYHTFVNHGANGYLTQRGTLNTGGTFFPDGKKLVLTMSVEKSADLYLLDVATKERRRLTFRAGIETQADMAPDGKKVVFVSDRTRTPQVYLLDLETGEDLRLTFDGVYNADPKWSPDGQLILFTKRVRGLEQIHIMDGFGENVREVTRGRFVAEQAEWSPDGRQIVFTSNRTGDFKLYIVSSDGTGLRRLTRTPKGFEETNPAWNIRRLAR